MQDGGPGVAAIVKFLKWGAFLIRKTQQAEFPVIPTESRKTDSAAGVPVCKRWRPFKLMSPTDITGFDQENKQLFQVNLDRWLLKSAFVVCPWIEPSTERSDRFRVVALSFVEQRNEKRATVTVFDPAHAQRMTDFPYIPSACRKTDRAAGVPEY